MRTLGLFKEMWDGLTTGSRAQWKITGEVDLEVVKIVMRDYGFYRQELERRGVMDDIGADIEDKYVKKHNYTNWEARQLGRTEFYDLTAKGRRALLKAIKAGA